RSSKRLGVVMPGGTGGGKPLAVRAKGHAVDIPGVPFEGDQCLAGPRVPYPDDAVPNTADESLAVWAKDHVGIPATALEGEQFLAILRIPDLHLFSASARQALAVRAEDHALDTACVPFEGEEILTSFGVPYLHRLVRRSASQALAVRAENHLSAAS